MRGTRTVRCSRARTLGIIPAYAGNTAEMVVHLFQRGDHPRVCGEHPRPIGRMPRCAGSSPRMRGTLEVFLFKYREHGIIPAYAGNTNAHLKPLVIKRDHPRVCGEHFDTIMQRNEKAGSSPRMRGTQRRRGVPLLGCGIIPAYAGNTVVLSPHVYYTWGSSPRMRGTPLLRININNRRGIIPAYAGNTKV